MALYGENASIIKFENEEVLYQNEVLNEIE